MSKVQSILFNRKCFNTSKARQWLDNKNIKKNNKK